MKKFIVIDHSADVSWLNTSEKEVIKALGYDSDKDTFEEVLGKVSGEYEVIEINEEGELRWLLEI